MSKKKKVLVIAISVLVLVSVFCVQAFANSTAPDYSNRRVYSPIFYPSSVVLADYRSTTLVQTDTTATFRDNGDYPSVTTGQGYSITNVYESASNSVVASGRSSVQVMGDVRTAYGYTYMPCNVSNTFYDFSPDVAQISLIFNNIWIPYNLINSDLNWLGNWKFHFYDQTNTDVTVPFDVFCEYSYVIPNGDGGVNYRKDSVYLEGLDSTMRAGEILTKVREAIPSTRLDDGLLIRRMTIGFYDFSDIAESFSISGSNKFVSESDRGAQRALEYFYYKYAFGVTVEKIYPTVLQEFTLGIQAIWEFELFGLFTLGEMFSAVLGLTLLTWLLKIFAR